MAFQHMAAGLARDIWLSFGNRAKAVLAVASIACGFVFWFGGRWAGIPHVPGYEMSLAVQPSPTAALLLTAVLLLAATAVGTAVAGTVRFDGGLFAAAVGLAALSSRGGTMRHVTQTAAGPAVFLAMAVELLLLGAVLGLAWFGLWLLYRQGRLAGDALRDGLRDQPHSLTDRFLAVATQAGATAVLVLLLARTDEKKQVLSAVAVASLLATLLAYAVSPARPSVCFWAGPIVVGIVGYLAAYASSNSLDPVALKNGQLGGLLAPLARPLPLDYASLGTAGAILGYWTSRQWQRAKELETEAPDTAPISQP
jgi:hypothetical protein